MVALLAPHNTPDADRRDPESPPHLRLVWAESATTPVPRLASVSTLRPRSMPPASRPMVAHPPAFSLGQLAAAALGAALLLGMVVSFSRSGPPATTWAEVQKSVVGVGTAPAIGERTILVKSGDTLWAIAAQLAPDQDRRQVVALLERRNGGSQLQAGQLLIVPNGLEGQS